jgi:hypothetical protein
MKRTHLLLPVLAAFAFGACQAPPYSATADARPIPPGLADRLPQDTLAYFSIPDIAAMREDMQKSALVRIFQEPDVQAFLAGILDMLDDAWAELRNDLAEEGVSAELSQWDALRSLECGISVRPNPDSGPLFGVPHVYALARLGLAEGLGDDVFRLIAAEIGDELPVFSGPGGSTMTLYEESVEGQPLRVVLAGAEDGIEIEITLGERGEGALSSSAGFKRAWNRNMTDGAACFGYLRLDGLFSMLMDGAAGANADIGPLLRPFFAECLAPLQSVSFASGWSDEGAFLNSLLDLREEPGAVWRAVAADESLAAFIPHNATAFTIKGSDPDPWMRAVLGLFDRAGAMQPDGLPMPLGQLAQAQAPELHAWLFGAHRPETERALLGFGERSFAYTVPSAGFGSESFVFTELDDAAATSAMLEQLMPRLRQVLNRSDAPVKLEMRRVKREVVQPDGSVAEVAGPAYYWLDFEFPQQFAQALAMIQFQLQPAIGVAPEGWMVMSISKSAVADVLRDGMTKPERSILANEAAAAFLAGLPKGAVSASWSDPRPGASAALGMIGGMLPLLGSIAGGELPVPVNLSSFPAPEVFLRNMRTSESWSWSLRGDFMSRSVGNMNLADLFIVLGAAAAVAPPALMIIKGLESGAAMPIGNGPEF